MAFVIEVIILAINGLPSGDHRFAVFSIVIPAGFRHFVIPFVFIAYADPLVGNPFAVLVHIVFVHLGGTGNVSVFI